MSENCLSVNVWTKGKSSDEHGKAVLLWIYGGGEILNIIVQNSIGIADKRKKDLQWEVRVHMHIMVHDLQRKTT